MEQYNVTGMSCAACSAHVEKAVSAVEGVTSVSVSLLTNSMGVEGSASAAEIVAAIEKAGYGATLKTASPSATSASSDELADTESPKIAKRLIASLIFLLPLMYVSMGHTMWNWPLPAAFAENALAIGLYQMLFAIIVMVINQKFFINGFTSLLHRSPNMDTLVALGSGASFGYSLFELFKMTATYVNGMPEHAHEYLHDMYFESAAMILTLITVGKLLESVSKGRTTDALKSLMNLAPKTATLLRDEAEIIVPISEVHTGDLFVVRSGESIPVDGVILNGTCAVDESALSGESLPVDKAAQDEIYAATINQAGFITCRATKVGEDTTLSQIIKMVSDAAATKAPIAKVADKVSGVFVPSVIMIAAITFLIWIFVGQPFSFSLSRAIAVLVISCPCALGLATPVAIMVGNGMGAKHGILFKTASSLEAAGKTDIVVLDKTGTITNGQPEVTDIRTASDASLSELLSMSYALEKMSEHPLSTAITSYVEQLQTDSQDTASNETNVSICTDTEEHITLAPDFTPFGHTITEFHVEPGNGLSGKIDTTTVYGGNYDYIQNFTTIPDTFTDYARQLSDEGKTPLYFATDQKLLGIIAIADQIRPSSKAAIKQLTAQGIPVVMLTGDNARTAAAIGRSAGVTTVISDVVPSEKEQTIRELQQYGKVTMVGDGINDAPALTRADIGIAIGAGTDVAIDAADIVLMKSDLADVPAAIRLSHAVLRNIHENLFWAFFYNIIGIPLAAGAYYHAFGWELNPMFGAAAMSISSFCVVMNALRLNLFKVHSSRKDLHKKHTITLPDFIQDVSNASDKIDTKNQITNSASVSSCCSKSKEETNTMTKTINITGMMCEHCQAHVTKALTAFDGVEAVVDHKAGTAVVTADTLPSDEALTKAVVDAGYEVTSIS